MRSVRMQPPDVPVFVSAPIPTCLKRRHNLPVGRRPEIKTGPLQVQQALCVTSRKR